VTLIVVSGSPGAGRSTIADAIGADLRWPVLDTGQPAAPATAITAIRAALREARSPP
jgi:adenylate kinase family enzyme